MKIVNEISNHPLTNHIVVLEKQNQIPLPLHFLKISTMNVIILVLGFLFGATLQYAKLNRYNVISGMATLENFAVAKAIAVAVGVGAVIIAIEIGLGFATYHIKPFLFGGIAIGGIIFGIGMAILGYCPEHFRFLLVKVRLMRLWE